MIDRFYHAPLVPNAKRILLGLSVLFALVIATPPHMDWVETAGRGLMQPSMLVDFFTGLAWAGLLGATLTIVPMPRQDRVPLAWIWLAKVLVMLTLMLIYEWHYGGDAGAYFIYGRFKTPFEDYHFGDGTALMYSLSALHHEYLLSSFHAMKVSFGFVGLWATYSFYRAGCWLLGRQDIRLLFVLGLFPSVLVWSSTLGKDPIVLLGVGLHCLGVARLYRRRKLFDFALLCGGAFLAAAVRPWTPAILFAPLSVFVVRGIRGVVPKTLFAVAALGASMAALTLFSDTLRLRSIGDVVDKTSAIAVGFSEGGSKQASELERNTDPMTMLAFAPIGAWTALFRPLPGDVLNVFGLLASLENLLLVVLLYRGIRRSSFNDLKHPILQWSILLVLLWSVVYGFVCYHNLGTSVRYRLQIFPVLLFVLAVLARPRATANQG